MRRWIASPRSNLALGVGLLALGVASLLLSFLDIRGNLDFKHRALRASATIVDVRGSWDWRWIGSDGDDYQVVVRFVTAAGVEVATTVSYHTCCRVEKGDAIEVLYDPQRPSYARLTSDLDSLPPLPVFGVALTTVLLLVSYGVWRIRGWVRKWLRHRRTTM